jgi:hypothetical protein
MNEIKVWRFQDAPECYKMLSNSGGDEDWVVFVPDTLKGEYIAWLEGTSFSYDKQEYAVTGGTIYIGEH